ncbi:MAG: hypothetical protein LCH47_10560 [Proteobacteria bacterium]|nr:hypothetical protein [Pseudomonadota bacterium]
MGTHTSMPYSADSSMSPRQLDTPEFIDRLAVELRAEGDPDLPHSYYVEQVKLRLSGKAGFEAAVARAAPSYEGSDCFRAWAMGE